MLENQDLEAYCSTENIMLEEPVSIHTEIYQACKHSREIVNLHSQVVVSYKRPPPEHHLKTHSKHLAAV